MTATPESRSVSERMLNIFEMKRISSWNTVLKFKERIQNVLVFQCGSQLLSMNSNRNLISINHQDSLLNMFPRMTQMGLLTQFGENDDFPKQGENGLLEEDQNTLEYQIHQFLKDVTVYVWNAHVFTKQVKDLPKVYFITLDYFKRKAESEEMKHLVQMVPILLQTYIQHFDGIQNIGIDYVQRCTFHHNQWIKSFDNYLTFFK
ncbi:Protein CBG08499 [Caenorhabditis briggsae]|uniref:Protein CBG08499 n=1 Tax=Caenorhabditis briggsae TaxID=6238 RepID=A8X6Q1_CAEBR|nr:Protein CBG08499 [Caenorhabditis briggsae]CAP28312.1 Protein CBG08499 [Caenorhabditis briggsae]